MGAGATAGPREGLQVPMQALPTRGFETRCEGALGRSHEVRGEGSAQAEAGGGLRGPRPGAALRPPSEEGVQGFRLLRGWVPGAGALGENRETGRQGQPWALFSTQTSPDPARKGGALKLGQRENRERQVGEWGAGRWRMRSRSAAGGGWEEGGQTGEGELGNDAGGRGTSLGKGEDCETEKE